MVTDTPSGKGAGKQENKKGIQIRLIFAAFANNGLADYTGCFKSIAPLCFKALIL